MIEARYTPRCHSSLAIRISTSLSRRLGKASGRSFTSADRGMAIYWLPSRSRASVKKFSDVTIAINRWSRTRGIVTFDVDVMASSRT